LANTLDLIVVGGGPAGSSCARRAAELGLSVLLVERERLPRPKPCAAGLSARALARLGPAVASIVHKEFRAIEVVVGRRTKLVWTGGESLISTTTRPELDAMLFEAAAAAGARAESGVAAELAGTDDASVGVRAGGSQAEWRARYVVAADGAGGALRARCGATPLRLSSAIYVRAFPPAGGDSELARDRITFDLTGHRRGYGWVFPKRDHLNVGVYTQLPMSKDIASALRAFLAARGLAAWRTEGPFAFPVPAGPRRAEAAVGRVLFVGDAAGLADPVTGEGISHAIASGRTAAESIATAVESGADAGALYARRVAAEVRPAVLALSGVGNLLYTAGARVADRALSAGPLRRAFLWMAPSERARGWRREAQCREDRGSSF